MVALGPALGVILTTSETGDWAQAMTSAVVMASRLAAPPTTMLAWQPAPDSLLKKIAWSTLFLSNKGQQLKGSLVKIWVKMGVNVIA